MIDHGPLNAPGVASLTEGAISTRSARKALKDGAAMGAFEELPGALAVYRPTRATLGKTRLYDAAKSRAHKPFGGPARQALRAIVLAQGRQALPGITIVDPLTPPSE